VKPISSTKLGEMRKAVAAMAAELEANAATVRPGERHAWRMAEAYALALVDELGRIERASDPRPTESQAHGVLRLEAADAGEA